MNGNVFKYVLLTPAVLLIGATTLYPMLQSFWISLHDWDLKESLQIGAFVGLGNYARALTDEQFWNAIFATMKFALSAVVVTLILSIAVALVLSKENRLYSYIRSILIVPFAMSAALIGYSWKFMLNPDYGFFTTIVGAVIRPIGSIVWLGSPTGAMAALVSILVWIWLPFMSLMLISGLMSLPREVFEASRVDGANAAQTLFRITLPMMQPIILVATILMTMFALKAFDPIVTLTAGGPGSSTEVLNYFVYKTGFRYFDMGYSSALGYILAMITIVFVIVYMRRLVKGGEWN